MPGIKNARTHADQFADLVDRAATELDPEDDPANISSEDDHDSDSEAGNDKGQNYGREHYERVGKSSLRQLEPDALGLQYSGSRVSRKRAADVDEEHDPFEKGTDSEDSEDDLRDDDEQRGDSDSSGEEAGGSYSGEGSEDIDEDDSELEGEGYSRAKPRQDLIDRKALREDTIRENKAVALSLSSANKADAEKGRAIKRQRRTYDSLLNARIRLQKGLIAMNSLAHLQSEPEFASGVLANDEQSPAENDAYAAAETAALALWNNLDHLRRSFLPTPSKPEAIPQPATSSTSLQDVWSRMESLEREAKEHRTSTLSKWSKKIMTVAQQTTAAPQHRVNLAANAQPSTMLDILTTQHLSTSNVDRLVQRTRIPRSCAPVQASAGVAESAAVFDDADFYGQLLKELLDSRNVDTSSASFDESAKFAAEQAFRAAQKSAKVKKHVDTKASKGRKMRYTVHERLQNFMAPESRGTWGDRQIDELFGSLLGQRLVQDDEQIQQSGDEDEAEEALRLFRN